jgi:hypothetical protein
MALPAGTHLGTYEILSPSGRVRSIMRHQREAAGGPPTASAQRPAHRAAERDKLLPRLTRLIRTY